MLTWKILPAEPSASVGAGLAQGVLLAECFGPILSREPAPGHPGAEGITHHLPSWQLTFSRAENKSPAWLSIGRHLTSLVNAYKSRAQELKHFLIYCLDIKGRVTDIKNRERQRTGEIGSVLYAEIARLRVLHGASDCKKRPQEPHLPGSFSEKPEAEPKP